MPFEKFDLESLDKERRKAIAKSIRTISVEELKKLGEEIFHYADDPWRETFFRFIAENAGATFHHAVTSDGVNIVYCRDKDKGMWFLPGSGMGPLQATGRQDHEGDDRRRPLSYMRRAVRVRLLSRHEKFQIRRVVRLGRFSQSAVRSARRAICAASSRSWNDADIDRRALSQERHAGGA